MDSLTILTCLSNRNRSIEDVRIVHEWFKRKTEIFKDLTLETMKDILNSAKMVEKYPNEIIIRQGDIGDSFYVLLSGSASIYISTDFIPITKEDQYDGGTSISLNKLNRATRSGNIPKMKMENKKPIKESDKKIYGEYIGNYTDGSCFGELALMQTENIRNATIITEEKSHLLSISRDLFDKAIRSYAEFTYKEKINFVNSHFLFKRWNQKLKHQVIMSLIKMTIYFGQDIIVQGQLNNGLILIKKGTAKVVVDIKQHHNQFTSYMAQIDIEEPSSKDQNGPIKDEIKSARDYSSRFKRDKIELAIIGNNDIIGDIEFGFNFTTNLLTVTASELCEVYLLKNVHIERMINAKRNTSTFETLQALAELKMNAYYKRCLIFDDLPLMKFLLADTFNGTEMQESLTDHVEKQLQKTSLLPVFRSGPVIDFYGPGSVFFRNRLKRKADKLKVFKAQRPDEKIRRDLRNNNFSQDDDINELKKITGMARESKKSIFYSHREKRNTFTDWETSSVHLNDLEGRMQSWMSNFEGNRRSKTQVPLDGNILRLSRFNYNDLPEDCRFIVKYKRSHADNSEEHESRATGGRDEDHKNNENIKGKKANESLTRQYTELEYFRLKEEMKIKEKRLSIFRIKHSI